MTAVWLILVGIVLLVTRAIYKGSDETSCCDILAAAPLIAMLLTGAFLSIAIIVTSIWRLL